MSRRYGEYAAGGLDPLEPLDPEPPAAIATVAQTPATTSAASTANQTTVRPGLVSAGSTGSGDLGFVHRAPFLVSRKGCKPALRAASGPAVNQLGATGAG